MKSNSGFAIFLVMIAALALLVGGGIAYVHYVYLPKNAHQENNVSATTPANPLPPPAVMPPSSPPAQPASTTATSSLPAVATSGLVKTDSTKPGGGSIAVQKKIDCNSWDCFTKRFASCAPTTLGAVNQGVVNFNGYRLEILGAVQGGCKMTFMYDGVTDTWKNQPMTCSFDNTIDFQSSLQRTFGRALRGESDCVGPLAKSIAYAGKAAPPSATGIDISNWKTYRNEKHGFSVKYPADWSVQECDAASILQAHPTAFSMIATSSSFNISFAPNGTINYSCDIRLGFLVDPQNPPSDAMLADTFKLAASWPVNISPDDRAMAHGFLYFISADLPGDLSSPYMYSTSTKTAVSTFEIDGHTAIALGGISIDLFNNANVYSIAYRQPDHGDYSKIFNAMASTFKFF